MAGRQTDSKIQPKRRKVTNSKKGTTSICKAPQKGGKDICGKRYIVNAHKLKHHKYCCNACNTRASYYNKKKKQKKLAKEIKKYKVSDEVELMEVKASIYWLEELMKKIDNALKPLAGYEPENRDVLYLPYMNELAFHVESFLPLIVEINLKTDDLYKDLLVKAKKEVYNDSRIRYYLIEKKVKLKMEEISWVLMTKNRIPHFNPNNGLHLFKDLYENS